MGARQQLSELQRSLYKKAFAEAKTLSANGAPTILNYSEKYAASLPDTFEHSDLDALLAAMARHRFVLYGDFHTLKQSQRGLLRLLKEFHARHPERPIILVLEMFKAKDQAHVDAYLNGELEEADFLRAIAYQNNWSFPWPPYRAILEEAQSQGFRVVGINTEGAGQDSLPKRDQFAARLMMNEARANEDALIVCLVGEYHLADEHLPKYLATESSVFHGRSSTLRIFTNVDQYAFKDQEDHALPTSEYLRLGERDFCILNCPPWIKWQSYVMWEEMRHADTWLEDDEDEASWYTEDTFDVDSQVLALAEHLAAFLDLKLERSALTHFTLHVEPGQKAMDDLRRKHRLSPREIDLIGERLTLDGHFFIKEGGTLLISDLSLNSLGYTCGQLVAAILRDKATASAGDEEDKFCRRVISAAAGMVASKILNPRRKGPDIWSVRRFVHDSRKKRLVGRAHTKRETAKAVLAFHEWVAEGHVTRDKADRHIPRAILHADHLGYEDVSRSLGNVLGFTLYARVMSNQVQPDVMRRLFKASRKASKQDLWDLYLAIMH